MKSVTRKPRTQEFLLMLRIIRKSKLTLASICILLFFYLLAILAPYVSPNDPRKSDATAVFAPPSPKYPLGTDHLGRDLLSRISHGARYSLFAPLFIVAITIIIGLPIGLMSGYFGGKLDQVLMRITDIFLSFPGITLALLFAYILGRGVFSAAFALAIVGWPSMARIVRGVVLVEKEKDYVIAARLTGKGNLKIIFEEILPNCLYPVIIQSVMMMGTLIIALAGLSFIGVGVQPPEPDWGVIISEGRVYLLEYPWVSLIPGIIILVVVIAYNLLGDRVRDALDPHLRSELAV
ncbi:MAG: ABC transporter permease [Candidatus Bathyarchaeia archaeon]